MRTVARKDLPKSRAAARSHASLPTRLSGAPTWSTFCHATVCQREGYPS